MVPVLVHNNSRQCRCGVSINRSKHNKTPYLDTWWLWWWWWYISVMVWHPKNHDKNMTTNYLSTWFIRFLPVPQCHNLTMFFDNSQLLQLSDGTGAHKQKNKPWLKPFNTQFSPYIGSTPPPRMAVPNGIPNHLRIFHAILVVTRNPHLGWWVG